jgi:hypothetical protein
MEAESCNTGSSASQPSLPQGVTYWDPHLGSVVHCTSEGLIKAKTTPGPQGFIVGTFEGFDAQPFVTEVPNLALEKSKTTSKQVEHPLAQEKGPKKKKQKGQHQDKKGQKNRHKGQGQEEKGQKRKQAPTSGVFSLTKASSKWYIRQKNEQGNFVHVVSVYQKSCSRFAEVAQETFDHLQFHPGTTKEEAIAMRDRLIH